MSTQLYATVSLPVEENKTSSQTLDTCINREVEGRSFQEGSIPIFDIPATLLTLRVTTAHRTDQQCSFDWFT